MFIVHTNSNFQSPLPQDNNCADSNLVIWGGGGRIILTHCTPDSDFKDISNGNHALHGELPTVFVVPAYVSIQCKSCLHPGKTPVQIAKSADYRLLQPQAVRFLASHLRRNSCATPLSLYWRSFKGLIALWAEDSFTPLCKANLHKDIHVTVFIRRLYRSISFQLKQRAVVCSCSAPNLWFEIFSIILRIVLLHGTVNTI